MPIKVVSLTVAVSGELLDRILCFLQKHPDDTFSIDEVVETAINFFLELPEIPGKESVNHGRTGSQTRRPKHG
jgi:hypothetical protein